jgi:N-glycosylase/DNA lyase
MTLFGHGWIDLAPYSWEPEPGSFFLALATGEGAADLRVRQGRSGLQVRLQSRSPAGREARGAIRRGLARALRLDEDLGPFWELCRGRPELRWVARRGAGRLLRAPTLFEDLTKLLLTTNCSWAATRGMVDRLVRHLGTPAPSGQRCFPDATTCASRSTRFYRLEVRAGYRAPHLVTLARQFAEGRLDAGDLEHPGLPTEEVRRRLLALPGFGPYAAGQALRLLGRYEDLALDSWCRGKWCRMYGLRRAPTDRWFTRAFARFAPYQGLALWMTLTADWHRGTGRGSAAPVDPSPLRVTRGKA